MNAWNPFDVPFPLLVPIAAAAPPPRRRRDLVEDWRGLHAVLAAGPDSGSPEPSATPGKVPFYKRELHLGRRRRAAIAGMPPVDAAQAEYEAPAPEASAPETPAREIVEIPELQVPELQDAETHVPEIKVPKTQVPEPVHDVPAASDVAVPQAEAPWDPAPTDSDAVTASAAATEQVERPDEPAEDDANADEPTEVAPPVDGAPAHQPPISISQRRRLPAIAPGRRRKARPPRGRTIVGLKIGTSQVAAAVVVSDASGCELVQLARRPIESGTVVDGEVRDAQALTAALKTLFDEHGLPKRDVRIGLASNRIGVRILEIVGISDEERFDNAVRFRAHEVLPVAVHESVLDYRVLAERENSAGELVRRVLLVVAPRDQVAPYTEVAQGAGLKLAGIDLEALALLRAFVEPRPFAVRAVDDTATVVVAIGHESSTLLVEGGGLCEFTRVFDWGGRALQDAIAQELDVPGAEAATILRHLSLSGPGRRLETLDELARAKALDAVRARLTPFTRELVSSLQFYQTQPDSLGIGEILVTGGTSGLEGLSETLHQMIGVSVRPGDPLARVRLAMALDPGIEAAIGSLAVPIGLAIDDGAERCVNLLPKDLQVARRRRPGLVAFAAPAAALVPVAALAALAVGAQRSVVDRRAELQGVQAEIAALPAPRGPRIDPRIVGEEAARATAVANVLGGRVAWDAVLGDLSRILPANVWLKQLSAKLPDAAATPTGVTGAAPVTPATPPPAPTGVTIEGYTYAQPDVARLLARLATVPSLTRVTLSSSQQEKLGRRDVVRFVILADLNQTGAAR